MTSLAKQLQKLAVPHTQAILGEDKKKASLLFDHKEAATIDRETFHALGINGLEELETIDSSFVEFEVSLFGDSSLTFERTVQTKDVNEKLDLAIRRFLIKMSPFCLLKPAHKALEWLIHRFHIHFYNTDELLMCFLPYHESKIFARVLQLIKFNAKITSKWDLLEPLQKAGVHLSRQTLVNHCRTDPAFMSFICDKIPKYVKVLSETEQTPKCRVLFSFYATTIIGVLEDGGASEVLLSALLPHISRGLQSRLAEYKAASYMILAQLFHTTRLKPGLLKTLQQIVAKSLVPELLTEGVACLLLMFQTQDMASINITKKSFRHLCKHFSVVEAIIQLYAQFEAQKFLVSFLDRIIPAAFKLAVGMATSGESSQSDSSVGMQEYMSMLHRLLSTITLPNDIAEKAAYKFLCVYIEHGHKYTEESVDDRIKESLQGIVRQLEGKHSAAVDKAVSRRLSECGNQSDRDLVQEFLNLYVLSVPHQLIADSETSLVLSLNHRLASVREKAVQTLIDSRDELEDASFLRDSLQMRLQDDDYNVVSAALSVAKELWDVLEDDQNTLYLLKNIVSKGIEEEAWEKPSKQALKILTHFSRSDLHLQVFASLVPCLFMVKESKFNLDLIKDVMTSPLVVKNTMLKSVGTEWKVHNKVVSSGKSGVVNQVVGQCLAVGLHRLGTDMQWKLLEGWWDWSRDIQDVRRACLVLVVLDNLITVVTEPKLRLDFCHWQARLVDTLVKEKRVACSLCSWTLVKNPWSDVINKTQLDTQVPEGYILKALYGVVMALVVPDKLTQDSGCWQYSGDGEEVTVFLQVCVRLYSLLLESATNPGEDRPHSISVFQQLLVTLNTTCFSDIEQQFQMLGLMWTQHANNRATELGLTLTLQARALCMGLNLFNSAKLAAARTIVQSPTVMLDLLVVLTSVHTPIRRQGLAIAHQLLTTAKTHNTVFAPFLKRLVKYEGEILADKDYVRLVMHSLFKHTDLMKKDGTAASPRKGRQSLRKTRSKPDGTMPEDLAAGETDRQWSLAAFLAIIAREATPPYQQAVLLQVFSRLNNKDVLVSLMDLMTRLLDQDKLLTSVQTECLGLLLERFTPETVDCLAPGTQGLQLFLKALKRSGLETEMGSVGAPQLVAINQITKDLYAALMDESQCEILSTLFDICVDSKQLDVATHIRRGIKHLLLEGKHIDTELRKCLKTSTASTVREAKRLKKPDPTPEQVGLTEFDSRDWLRATVVLEAVHTKKKVNNFTVLVPTCFQILSSILESDNHSSAEYLKQLILTLLYNICTRLDSLEEGTASVPERQFNMDLIVQCIRSSDNPQTHHHALLLLTAAAKIFPEHLLHNMMSVFTFMGANIMRQDDAYSFHIISKILETVVPALITACEQRKRVPKGVTNDLDDIITMVIQVFVDSYPYVPEHRRHLLFNKLLSVIGEKRYLWRLVSLMMKHVVSKGTLKSELAVDTPQDSGSSDTDFCLLLCADFSSTVQLSSAKHMLEYILKLPDEKEDDTPRLVRREPESFSKLQKEDAAVFNPPVHTDKQLRHFKYAVINLLVQLFSSPEFVLQVGSDDGGDVLQEFRGLLETVLQVVACFSRLANRYAARPSAKFWRALGHKAHDMLDKFVSLMPESMFIDVIGGLLSHDLPTIQRRAMDLLNTKLQHQKDMEHVESASLLPLVERLRGLVESLEHEVTEDSVQNCQTAFISLKLLCRNIGSQHREPFVEVLKTSVEVFKNEAVGVSVSSCALLCIAEICQTLRVHVIQHLPTFMPAIITVLADHKQLVMNELYVVSVVTTLNKVMENLAHFLSPYLHDILTHVCILSSKTEKYDILQKPAVQMRMKTIRATLSTNLPTRVLLPVVTECYSTLVTTSKMGVVCLMSVFGEHLTSIPREEMTSHMTQLQTFFLRCLDVRVDFPELSNKKTMELESVTIDTIIAMVLKLSEATFKPFLFKVFDWATTDPDHRDRILVFYRLTDRLSEKLRSLFSMFAGNIVDHAAKILDENNSLKNNKKFFPTDKSKRKKGCQVLTYILDTVTKCCQYDTQGFINKERFDLLMQPLVDQLENEAGGDEVYGSRVHDHLVPCIVQLCVAAGDDSLWRSLNYQLCLKTRSQDSKVKEASLVTLDELHKKLGEDYMPLLPDTVPFLAELMEDECEAVEKKCHEVIREMEKTLGEPLQKYF
ncbi:HEAT repeat-containing protein 1-like [Mya arenaria]|uniref:HEAT repeat-containing protein 1-like n=1 Tax=Mya arenaria TaxID=6604 RepID=UPI0022E4B98B|nr:HEAT repeat-containing protein 1-like [Mya arenaria]